MNVIKKATVLLSAAVFFTAAGCGSGYTPPKAYFELSAFTNNSDSEEYDSKYFYRNDLKLFGADASCLYVPESRHEKDGTDEYGGYYYMYPSSTNVGLKGLIAQRVDGTNTPYSDEKGTYFLTNAVYRSKDLVDWELCGAVDGTFSTKVYSDEWAYSGILAPDPIYDEKSEKYYIYEQTEGKLKDENPSLYTECLSSDQVGTGNYNHWDRMYIGIYVSDYPTGPFELVDSESYYGGADIPNPNGKVITKYNPPINFTYDLGLDIPWGTIDAHPFRDEDGQLYLYFCHHLDSAHDGVDIWGMKMKDMITPDYSTLTLLVKGGYTTVKKDESKWADAPWSLDSYVMGEKYELENGDHGDGNEGAFMIAKNYTDKTGKTLRRYLLCYSGGGYNNKYYDISQTISDESPLGPFVKPTQYASSIVGTSYDNSWQMGCGHGCLVYSPEGDELFILGWSHVNDDYAAEAEGRFYSVDKVHWVENPDYGLLLYGNGPTKSCQPRMYDTIGVRNIAKDATISVSSKGKYSGAQYLNDELFVSHAYYGDWEFQCDDAVKITLTFDEPRTVGAVMVYNTYDYNYAFSKVDFVEFNLAERPSWYTSSKYASVARVSDIKFNSDFIGSAYDYVQAGASCLASFNQIKVTSITVSVSEKIKTNNSYKGIRISDIVVLGN